LFLVLAGGAVLRVLQYAHNRSLWLDEAMLANNVIDLPLSQLMPPHLFKVAPFGFLVAVKQVIGVLGSSELAFRLIPVLAGLASLFLLLAVTRQILSPDEQLLALALFALSPPLVFYSSEAKWYSSDVLIALAITTAAMGYLKAPTRRNLLGLGIAGAVAVWVSYPAIFVLAAAGPVMLWSDRSQRRPLLPVLVVGSSWIASFIGSFFLMMQDFTSNEALLRYWSEAFAPFPPLAWSDVAWYGNSFLDLLEDTLGLGRPFVGFAAFLSIVGVVRLWQRRRFAVLLLLGPLGAAVIASMARLYPVEGRVALFWSPALAICVAAGAGLPTNDGHRRWTMLLVAALLLPAPTTTVLTLLQGQTIQVEPAEETRPLLQEMVPKVGADDSIYVYYGARSAVRFYARRMDWNHPLHFGDSHRHSPEGYLRDIDELPGARVWLVFSHVYTSPRGNEERLIVDHMRGRRKPVATIRAPGASAYCFDLR
jgi:hypothetical protein